jgi:hypothetical protein
MNVLRDNLLPQMDAHRTKVGGSLPSNPDFLNSPSSYESRLEVWKCRTNELHLNVLSEFVL